MLLIGLSAAETLFILHSPESQVCLCGKDAKESHGGLPSLMIGRENVLRRTKTC